MRYRNGGFSHEKVYCFGSGGWACCAGNGDDGFYKPVFSFSYSYATDMIIVSLSVVAACFIYMIPTCVAASRKHRNTMAIAVLNLFFGWTLLVFVGCLVWSLINVSDKK